MLRKLVLSFATILTVSSVAFSYEYPHHFFQGKQLFKSKYFCSHTSQNCKTEKSCGYSCEQKKKEKKVCERCEGTKCKCTKN
jgi:hypothetical protein